MKYSKIFFISSIIFLSSCTYYEKLFKETKKPFIPTITISSKVVIDDLWSVSAGDGSNQESNILQPSLDKNNNVYVIDSDGLITSINYENGKKNWSNNLGLNVTSGITFYNNTLFFGTSEGKLYAYNLELLENNDEFLGSVDVPFFSTNLKPNWHTQLSSEVTTPVTGSYNNIFFKTNDGDTFSVDMDSGLINWRNINRNVVLSLRGSGSIAADSENIYVARDDGTLVSLLQDSGKLNWYASISPKSGRTVLESLRDVEMTPYNDFGVIYAGSYQGNLIAADSLSGNLLWSNAISVATNVVADEKNIYTSSTDGYLYSIGKYDGIILWKTQLTKGQYLSQPLLFEDKVIVLNESGFISILDKLDGNVLKYEKIVDEIDYQIKLIKVNKSFLILSKSGRLTAFSISERNYEKFNLFSW